MNYRIIIITVVLNLSSFFSALAEDCQKHPMHSGSDESVNSRNSIPDNQDLFRSLEEYNIIWDSQSRNSSESMPCGGGDIGLNVWVEDGDILFYISRSGTFDQHNTFLKLGRVRIALTPNPFDGGTFRQELDLGKGMVTLHGSRGEISVDVKIWVDVFRPVVHVEIESNKNTVARAVYENWRYRSRLLRENESFANSYKWAAPDSLMMHQDNIVFHDQEVLFYHRNPDSTIFDVTVHQQGMDSVKSRMFNPLRNLTFGGIMRGENMHAGEIVKGNYAGSPYNGWVLQTSTPRASHRLKLYFHTAQTGSEEDWIAGLQQTVEEAEQQQDSAFVKSQEWWQHFWKRSYVFINPGSKDTHSPAWQSGRNYQLFRYMLACNAYGEYPTKFNGGLFTYDPCYVDSSRCFTPDFRNWGGGTMTAQNQRLVYFPMIKSGDFDFMPAQFKFYLRSLKNAELRTKVYWDHAGACFTEQLENFGLPNCSEYGWDRPENYDKGMQYNAWLEYQWDTVLEFCLMMLEMERYAGKDISAYLPFIESCLTFFDEHYQYLAGKRGRHRLDEHGHLVLYPGSACETYKMAYNASSTIAGLKTLLTRLQELPEKYFDHKQRLQWEAMQERIPPINYRNISGYKTIAPAITWERINNTETPQLYPVYPWGMFGIGKPEHEVALNTWKYDPDAIKFRSHTGWKQDNIFAARLGLANEAAELTFLKLKDSQRRFPAFWGPGFDWVPDHNQGGSGMIGIQEMLIQADGKKIYLFPAWPEELDVHFKLHAPYNTTIEGRFENGEVKEIIVMPEERRQDVILVHGG